MEPLSTFGQYLKEHRINSGVSLRKVARSVGYSHSSIREMELGDRPPPKVRYWGQLIELIPTLKWEELENRARNYTFQRIGFNDQKATAMVRIAEILDLEDDDAQLRALLKLFGHIPGETT